MNGHKLLKESRLLAKYKIDERVIPTRKQRRAVLRYLDLLERQINVGALQKKALGQLNRVYSGYRWFQKLSLNLSFAAVLGLLQGQFANADEVLSSSVNRQLATQTQDYIQAKAAADFTSAAQTQAVGQTKRSVQSLHLLANQSADESYQQSLASLNNEEFFVADNAILTVIDPGLEQWEILSDAVQAGEMLLLKAGESPLEQIIAKVKTMGQVKVLNILSHGADGEIYLAGQSISAQNLNEYKQQLQELGALLTEDGQLQLFGCDVAKSGLGKGFVTELAQITGADVAGSVNLTGSGIENTRQPSDWDLEYFTGEQTIGIAQTFNSKRLLAYNNVLATVYTFDDIPAQPFGYMCYDYGECSAVVSDITVRAVSSNPIHAVSLWGDYMVSALPGEEQGVVYAGANNGGLWLMGGGVQNSGVPRSLEVSKTDASDFTPNSVKVRIWTYRSVNSTSSPDATFFEIVGLNSSNVQVASIKYESVYDDDTIDINFSNPASSVYTRNNGGYFTGAPTLTQSGSFATVRKLQFKTGPYQFGIDDLSIGAAIVNTASTATNVTQNLSFTEDPGNSVAINDIVVTDPDAGDTITARFSLSNPAAGTLTTGTFGSATSTYNAGLGVWTVEGSVTDVNAALAAVAFNPATHWDQNFTITTRIRDSASTGPADGLLSFIVTPVNDAPTATNLTQSKTATEGGGAVALDDIVVTDVDTGDTVTATFTLSDSSAGTLSTGTFGSATSTFNAGTGVWTVTGSVADVNAALAAVAFTPSANNDQSFTITTRIRDAAGTGPADGAISVTVTPVNDAPTDITLSGTSILQSTALAGVAVGTLSSTDIDSSSFTYSLINAATAVAGTCAADTGNGSFQIDGDVLETAAALTAGEYNLCIQTSDGAAGFKKGFTVTVTDDIAPVISSVSVPADAWYIAGQTLIFTVNTTEDVTVTGLPTLPLTIGLADLTASYAAGSGTTELTFSYTIQAGDNDSDGITLGGAINSGGGTLRDAAGNNMVLTLNAVGSTTGVLVDTSAPAVQSLNPANGSATVDPDANFVMTFSENIKLGTAGSIVIYDALNNPVSTIDVTSHAGQLSISNNVLTVNPTADLTENSSYYIQIASGAITDMAGLAYSGIADSTSWSFTVADLSPPAVTGITVSGTPAVNAATMQFTVAFDETVSGVSTDDFVLTTTSGNASGSISSVSAAESSYTVTVESIGGSGGLRLDLNANTNIVDSQGNGNGTNGYVPAFTSGASHTVDRVAPATPPAPVLNAASDSGSSNNDGVTNVTTPTITGTAEADSTVTLYGTDGITILGTTTADGSGNWSITTSSALAEGNHSLSVKATDAAGNESNASQALTIQIDTTAPAISSVLMADTTLIAGETSLVTFTFSKAVADFTNALTVSNGSLSPLISEDGITWTATFTPAIDTTALVNTISVAGASVTDIAGNAASGTAATTNYTIDTLRPVATIVVTDTELNLGETSAVTITFNRAVSGFANDDLTITNGTLTEVSSTDGGLSWSATFTPATNTDAPVNVITLDNSGVQDSAGNTGTGTTDSNVFAVHTVPRTLVVTSLLDTGDDGSIGNSLADDESDGNGLSLREALNWGRNGDSITFDQGGDIVLNGSPLIVKSSVIINGDVNNDGAADITVSGNNASRVMRVNNNVQDVDIKGLTLTQGNSHGGGAGLYLESGADVILRNSNLTNNTETSNGGGAVYGSGVSFTLIDSTVSGNTSVAFGGALRIIGGNGTFLNLINTTLTGNSTTSAGQHGGAIQFGGETLTVINSTISGNAVLGTTSMGGGLGVTSGNSYIYNSTIVGNAAADSAGGVYANGIDTFVNTVTAGNTSGADATAATGGSPLATGGIADDVGGTIEVATNNYFGTQATVIADNNNLNNQGTTQLLLGNLDFSNGSHNRTHRPQSGSALVDAGSNVALPFDTYDVNKNGNTAEVLPTDANGSARISNIVDIGAVEGNSKPVIGGTPATSVDENTAYSFTPTAADAEGEALIFSITNKPSWAVFNSNTGELNGTPTSADIGVTSGIVISVSDGHSSVSLPAFTVTVVNVNDAPTIAGTPATSVNQDVPYSFIPTATDIDAGDTLTFSIANKPAWANFNTATGALTGTPTRAHAGTTNGIVISVSDGSLSASLPAFNLMVVAVNAAPVIRGTPPLEVTLGDSYSFTPMASDADNDKLTFSVVNLPAWARFDSATGSLTGVPTAADAGAYSGIGISVSDGTTSASLPIFTLTVVAATDSLAPVVTAPADLLLNATALYTPVSLQQLLGLDPSATVEVLEAAMAELASDNSDSENCCVTRPVQLDTGKLLLLPPGRHEIVWQATNAAGLTGRDTQIVNLRPLVSFGKHQVAVRDSEVGVRVILNGPAPVYPLDIPFVIADTSTAWPDEYDLPEGLASFTEPGQTEVVVPIVLHELSGAADSELILRLDDQTPAGVPPTGDIFDINAGAADHHVISIRTGNVAPAVSIQLSQGGINTLLVTPTGGPVTATALVVDPNPTDVHDFDWQVADRGVYDLDGDAANATWVFEPTGLTGRQQVAVTVTDQAGASGTAQVYFRVVNEWPVLDASEDSDGDGIDDLSEGFGDDNGNGIPNYLDNMRADNILPQQSALTASYLLECDPGVHCRLGPFALMSRSGGVQILEEELAQQPDLIPDETYIPVGGIFDFEIRDLPEAGQSVRVVLPQQAAIPADAVYRKFQNGQWITFVENTANRLHSAPGTPGYCPPPGSADWQEGLVQGYWCVQLTLEDGGPNDADGAMNASVADPGVVSTVKPTNPPAEPPAQPRPPVTGKSKSGGAVSIFWLLLLGSVGLLRHVRSGRLRAP